jgi:hypothetical protein
MLRKSILRILFREAEIVQQVGVVIIAIRSSDHGRFAHSFIHSFTPFQRFGIHRFDKFHSVRLRRLALANFINLFRLQIRQPSVAKLLTHFEPMKSSFGGCRVPSRVQSSFEVQRTKDIKQEYRFQSF